MTTYPFDMQLVVDPNNPFNVVANGQVYIYDTSDTGNASPLALTDPNGLPLINPLVSTNNGFLPAFRADVPQVKWASGGFVGYFNSFEGLREVAAEASIAAAAAATAAISAADAASESSQFAQGPTDLQVDEAVRRAAIPSNLSLALDGTPYVLPGANDISVYEADGSYYFTT